ncbi:MAG: M23 family metallopeptidase [Treponema sp.]|jgi:murein DD-endopeptidase MepM/ murein hydrolase activator NlpD|nr:M23 family metallopeptidase [Treponema sp.]
MDKNRLYHALWIVFSYSLLYTAASFVFSCAVERRAGVFSGGPEAAVPNGMGGISFQDDSSFVSVSASPDEGGMAPADMVTGVPEPSEYSRPQMLFNTSYTVRQGDTIGQIAMSFGLNQDTILSVNGVKNARLLQIGQQLKIPNQDGILYKVKKGDSLGKIAENYQVEVSALRTVNELFSERVNEGSSVFVPGAKLNLMDLQEINGDLFNWPVRGYITSRYGYRASPFGGARQFHTGIDIGAAMGTPIRAAMAGRVSGVGYNDTSGNYVVITHHSGYRSLYAHLSVVRTKAGAYVRTGDLIGDVGSTGLSTGPHLHFTVYKNGVTINPSAVMH